MKDEGRLERGATAAPGPQRLRDACQAMRACVALPDAHTHTHTRVRVQSSHQMLARGLYLLVRGRSHRSAASP